MTDSGTMAPVGGGRGTVHRGDRPFGRTVPIGRWGGIAVSAHWTTLMTAALFTEVLAVSVFPAARPGLATSTYWLTGFVTAVAFLLTLLAHELAHALVARRLGVGVRGITLWLLGGLTELEDDAPTARRDALIAVAGPAASLWLGSVSALFAYWLGGSSLLGVALGWLAAVNVLLATFNLLPGSPLDGGRLLRALLWWRWADLARAERVTARAGRMLGFVLIGIGFFDLAAGSATGLWLALLGWFIVNAANGSGARPGQFDRLRNLRADAVMTLAPDVVAEWWTVDQYLARSSSGEPTQPVLPTVDFDGLTTGAVTRRELDAVPASLRADTRIRDIARARRRPAPLIVSRERSAAEVAAQLIQHGGVAVVVNADQHALGFITAAELARTQSAVRVRR